MQYLFTLVKKSVKFCFASRRWQLQISLTHSLVIQNQPNIKEVTSFVQHIVSNRPYKEKCLGESRYNMLNTKRKTSKKKYNKGKCLASWWEFTENENPSSIICHILHVKLLNSCYISSDPSLYRCKLVEKWWEPIWFEGSHLPHLHYAVDEYGKGWIWRIKKN